MQDTVMKSGCVEIKIKVEFKIGVVWHRVKEKKAQGQDSHSHIYSMCLHYIHTCSYLHESIV